MELSVLSQEYVKVPVDARVGGTVIDPTSDGVQLAFPAHGVDPVTGDWKNGIWETDTENNLFLACCLVGPGGTIALARGPYDVWVKVTDSPEVPVKKSGFLRIT